MESRKLRVLIITYYWPPAGGPGVQRWLKFVKYLPEFGVEPTVYIPENPSYPMTDTTLEADVAEGVKLIRGKIWEPYGLASVFSGKRTGKLSRGLIQEKQQSLPEKLMLWVRGNLFIPDARKFWISPSVKLLKDHLAVHPADVIVTTGPPHSTHLIGMKLKEELNLPWIADFRDPWTGIGYHEKLKLSKYARKRHQQLEAKVMDAADLLLTTSEFTSAAFEDITSTRVMTITNGYDNADLSETNPSDGFTIAHIGSLLTGRDPEILWQVLSELVLEEPGFASELKIVLAGAVSEDVVLSLAKYQLRSFTKDHGYVDHQKALQLQREARILLLLEKDTVETREIIPGKVFEYMAAGRPVIAMGPDPWAARAILEDSGVGKVFSYRDKNALKSEIRQLYSKYRQGGILLEEAKIDKYSRRSLTAELSKLLIKTAWG